MVFPLHIDFSIPTKYGSFSQHEANGNFIYDKGDVPLSRLIDKNLFSLDYSWNGTIKMEIIQNYSVISWVE